MLLIQWPVSICVRRWATRGLATQLVFRQTTSTRLECVSNCSTSSNQSRLQTAPSCRSSLCPKRNPRRRWSGVMTTVRWCGTDSTRCYLVESIRWPSKHDVATRTRATSVSTTSPFYLAPSSVRRQTGWDYEGTSLSHLFRTQSTQLPPIFSILTSMSVMQSNYTRSWVHRA